MKTYRFKLYAHKRNRKIIKNIELSGKVYNHLNAAININREGASSLRKEGIRLHTEASLV